jgi:hypothetical protein
MILIACRTFSGTIGPSACDLDLSGSCPICA